MAIRLHLIFFVVLGVSVIGTSLAAWAITFASSHYRVTALASEFTDLAHTTITDFNDLVNNLLQNSSALVDYILLMENKAGLARINETQNQVLATANDLIGYTLNTTLQSETQIELLVDGFRSFVTDTLAQFQLVSQQFSVQLRYELAMKVQTAFESMLYNVSDVMIRLDALNAWGSANISHALAGHVTGADAEFLAAMCTWSAAVGAGVYAGTALGRFYMCGPSPSFSWFNETEVPGQYTHVELMWPVPQNTTARLFKADILSSIPTASVAGENCSLSPMCDGASRSCGYDPRCRPWYTQCQNTTVSQLLMSAVYANAGNFVPVMTLTYPILDYSTAPPTLAGVLANDFSFSAVGDFLSAIGVSKGTHMAVVINDTALTVMGSTGQSCEGNATNPGDPTLPLWSMLRSCDLRIAALGFWIQENQATLTNGTTVQVNDTVWDVFPSQIGAFAYYTAVGMELSAMYGAIWAAEANATSMFQILIGAETQRLAASANQTRAYMEDTQEANLRQIQTMRHSLLQQLDSLTNTSQQLLQASQGQSTQLIDTLMQSQMQDVDTLRTSNLSALNVTAAWTIGVVLAMLLVVLLIGNLGIMRIVTSIVEIIVLMESVAEMRVEQLEVPQNAFVLEVARIQVAFQSLVKRLGEYKSYMPASLFQPASVNVNGAVIEKETESEGESVGSREPQSSAPSTELSAAGRYNRDAPTKPIGKTHKTEGQRLTRRTAAAVVFNVCGFQRLLDDSDGSLDVALSCYVTAAHESVAKALGHIDCVLGDQVFASFNAHIPCADPIHAAANAALNFQDLLSKSKASGLTCQIGVSCGSMVTGTAGYARFKTVVSLGTPMKLAALLARLSQFDRGGIICDGCLEERLRFTHLLSPVDVVHLPRRRGTAAAGPRRKFVFLLHARKTLAVDEWMYQLQNAEGDWDTTFTRIANAKTQEEAHRTLQEHLGQCPNDVLARRLLTRLPAWRAGLGVPLCEGADHAADARVCRGSPQANTIDVTNLVSKMDSLDFP